MVSGEQELQKNDGAERSADRKVAERERSGERGIRNRLERGAAFSPLTVRSHALVATSIRRYVVCDETSRENAKFAEFFFTPVGEFQNTFYFRQR